MPQTNFDEPHGEPSLADHWIRLGLEHRKREQTRLQTALVVARWLARKMEDRTVHEPTGMTYRDAAQSVWDGLREGILFGVYSADRIQKPLSARSQQVKLKGYDDTDQAKIVLVLAVRAGITDQDLMDPLVDETLIELSVIDVATQFDDRRIADVRRLSLRDECLGQFPDIPLPEA